MISASGPGNTTHCANRRQSVYKLMPIPLDQHGRKAAGKPQTKHPVRKDVLLKSCFCLSVDQDRLGMKWMRSDGKANLPERLGMGIGFFSRFAESFWPATGMEVDLVHEDGEPWNSVAGRVRNPICRNHALKAADAKLCEECFRSACKTAREKKAFHTVTCFAGQSFSVCPLGDFGGQGVLLLTGRVPKSGRSLPGAKSPASYEGALGLLELFLPSLKIRLGMDILISARDFSKVVQDAIRYVDGHFNEKINVDAVAAACGVSEDYLSRSFKKETGRRLSRYISAVRIGHAMYLLQNEKLSVSEIAFHVGFQSLSQFNRTFRTLRGISPSEFRRQEQGATR